MSDPPATDNPEPSMALCVSALLSQLIDYAGLFPPAKLDMAATVRNYADFAAGDDAWMLGRLIVPVDRLDEFETQAAGRLPAGEDDEPWHLSGLTVPGGDERLEAQLVRIAGFNARHAEPAAGLARIDTIELKAGTVGEIEAALDGMPEELFPFFELPVSSDPRGLVAALVGSDAGAKVRTGGLEPRLYPSPEHLARFIRACAAAPVPFKATAGMHHPLRHYSEAVGTEEFGFLNVFVGAAIARHHEIDVDELVRILTDQDLASFVLEDGALGWRDRRLDADQVDYARTRFAVSFGSCSFDEPLEDLRKLDLLP